MRRLSIIAVMIISTISVAYGNPDPQARLDRVIALHDRSLSADAGDMDARQGSELTPMLAEIKAVLDSARVAENELTSQHQEGAREVSGTALAMSLAAHKKAVHLRILRIQAKHARLEGRLELEERIFRSIAEMERPVAPGAPKMKPVPAPTAGPNSNRR